MRTILMIPVMLAYCFALAVMWSLVFAALSIGELLFPEHGPSQRKRPDQ